MNLDAVGKALEIKLAGAVTTNQLPITASYADLDATFAVIAAAAVDLQTNNATAVVVAAGLATGARKITDLSVCNKDTVQAIVTVRINNGGTMRDLLTVPLEPGESLIYG